MTLTEFLKPFFPDETEPLFVFGYSPKELPDELKEKPHRIETSRMDLQTNRELQQALKRINQTQGLYFTVNAGGTKKEDISRINAVFCEIDDLPIDEQHEIFDNCDLPSSVRVETKKSVHAYWLLSETLTVEEFIYIQRGLIEKFKSDKAIKNQNRVMRLPFFNHVSFDAGEYLYKQVKIHTFKPEFTFSLFELKQAFAPAPEQPARAYAPPVGQEHSNGWDELFTELRRRIEQLPGYSVEPCGKLASARGVCHNGDTNRTLVVNLETGKVFCRNECSFDEIIRAVGLERPQKQERKFQFPRVAPRAQSSKLYQWLSEVEAERRAGGATV